MTEEGIIIPLRQRIKDLEEINHSHQKKNGQLRVEIQEKDKIINEKNKQISDLKKKLTDMGLERIQAMREKGHL